MKINLGNILSVLPIIQQVMNTVQGLKKPGSEKKVLAMALTQQTISLIEGVAGKDYITDPLVVAATGNVIDAIKNLENVIADVKARKAQAKPVPPV